jgi:hypothetical protein
MLAMSIEQQIDKLKGHACNLADELEWVIQCFELISPAVADRELIDRFTDPKRIIGFRICRRSMGRYTILGITRVTYDTKPQNPTVTRLVNQITDPSDPNALALRWVQGSAVYL